MKWLLALAVALLFPLVADAPTLSDRYRSDVVGEERRWQFKKKGGKMQRREYHVVPQDGKWAVKRDNAQRSSAVFERKVDAENRGRELARGLGAELIIHKLNGRIQNPNSYGNDPCPPRDRVR